MRSSDIYFDPYGVGGPDKGGVGGNQFVRYKHTESRKCHHGKCETKICTNGVCHTVPS